MGEAGSAICIRIMRYYRHQISHRRDQFAYPEGSIELNRNDRTFDRRLFLAYIVCSLAAIFYLPSLVPLHPSVSDSYVFAYNNRVGIALLLSLVAIGSVWTKGLNLQLRTTSVSQPLPLKILFYSLLAVMSGCLAMYMLAGRFGGLGESSYFIDRAWLLSQGKIPYLDFEWAYGVSFLYGPIFLQHLLSINIVHAYYLFWIFNWLLGTLLLFTVINMVDYPTNSKRSIFILLFGTAFLAILTMGVNYTFLRYYCPLFFVLVVQKLFNRSGAKSQAYAVLLAVTFTAILLLISPETAIAHAFACVCIFIFSAPSRSSRSIATFAGLLLGLAVVFWAALKTHVLDTLKANSGGADSFPISFAPHILLFFAAIFVCACYVFRQFQERRINNTFGLIAFSIPMTAAALGRCDPGHVVLNGLGIFLASMFYISNHRTAWKWYRAAFIVVLIILPTISGTWFYLPSLARCGFNILSESDHGSQISRSLTYLGRKYIEDFASPAKRAKREKTLENAQHMGVPKTIDFSRIYPTWHGTFLAPLGYKPNGLGTYLSNQIDYGHFEGLENANTVDAIHIKLTEIKSHPEKALLLPDRFENSCQVNIPAERQMMSVVFAFPYFGKAVHPESVRQPICSYIFARYRLEQAPTLQNFSYGLWVAKPVEENASQNGI
jgi:hypothetical protein